MTPTLPQPPSGTTAHHPLCRRDWLWLTMFMAAGTFIWLRDQTWMAAAGEVLPVLAALPLFWWCGRPWQWRREINRNSCREWFLLALLVWVAGITLNLIVLLSLAWTIAAWGFLATRLEEKSLSSTARLLPLLWLAFPWLALEGDWIGWYFRLSAAGATQAIFGALGFDVVRQGVVVSVQGLPISVDAECSGLKVLQAMLMAGLAVAHRRFGTSAMYWWTLPVLVAAAWCANTLRILMVSVAALSFGTTFATGSFHFLGGWLLLVLMFACCLLLFSGLERLQCATFWRRHETRLRWGKIGVLIFCAMMCGDLLRAWRWSPFDWGGTAILWFLPVAVALVLWIRPAAAACAPLAESALFPAAALAMLLFGTAASLNVFKHAALALAAAAFMPRGAWTFIWFALAVCWMPVLGWVTKSAGVETVWLLRLFLGAGAVTAGLISLRQPPRAASKLAAAAGKVRWWPVLLAAVVITLAWDLVPLPDAASRLLAFPQKGLGFSSVDIPLSRVEASIYRGVKVIKRLYRMRSRSIVLVVIDGSRNRHAVHDPVYCFRGGGWRITAEQFLALPGGTAKLVKLERDGQRTEAVYWFTDGSARHASAPLYWCQTAWRRLTFGTCGAEPLLVVVQPAAGDTENVDWGSVFAQMPQLPAL